jgi:integrase
MMYAFWSKRTAAGSETTPRQVSEACKTTVHAARTAVRRYRSGIAPKPVSPGLAPKTVRNVHAFLHRALVDAVAWKYLSDNPASNVKPPRRPRTRRQVWKPEEIQTILVSVRHDRFAALFLLELTTGIRRGQVCGLQWDAVDLDSGEISVHNNRVVVGGQARDKAGGKTRNGCRTTTLAPSSGRRAHIFRR